jgi:2-C-methyl-D-erythritol 4-phosphate cytidylyltransferase
LGAATPKAFLPLAGRPMFDFSLEAIARSGAAEAVVLVVPVAQTTAARTMAREMGRDELVVAVVAGGATRADSVRCGLAAAGEGWTTVLCQDAARPFASAELYRRVAAALSGRDGPAGAVPVVMSVDTVKRIRDGRVLDTIPREEIGFAQTPQGFRVDALRAAHERFRNRGESTDDAVMLEEAGFRVAVVQGEARNFKVTGPEDLEVARALAEARAGSEAPDRPRGGAGPGSGRRET